MQYVKQYSDDYVRRGVCPAPPPPLGPNDPYRMFGQPFIPAEDTIISSLESQGLRRLFSNKELDRKKELKKLNQSILVNFLDLLDLLIKAPDSPKREEKIEDLNLLFINMHHLINEFRPHQARETLRVMLHVQRRRRMQVADKFREHLDKVQETIKEALENLPEPSESDEKHLVTLLSDIQSTTQSLSQFQQGGSSSIVAPQASTKTATFSNDSAAANLDEMLCHFVDEQTACFRASQNDAFN